MSTVKKVLKILFGHSRAETFILGMVFGFLLFMFVVFKPFVITGTVNENHVNGEIVIDGVELDDVGRVRIDGWVRYYVVYKRENLPFEDDFFENVSMGGENFGEDGIRNP